MLKDAEIFVNADFIIGCPQETKSDILETFRYIQKSAIDAFDVNIFSPGPGTMVWTFAENEKIVGLEMDWH